MRVARLAICFCGFLCGALAQSDRGTITGTVMDPAGAVVPGASMVATDTQTSTRYQATTTLTGNYTISQVPAGTYEISAEMQGFRKFVQRGVRIFATQTARIDVSLQIGGTTEVVEVNADAPLLKTESAEQSSTVSREKLNELPLNFGARGNTAAASIRNPYSFVNLVPGGNISSYSSIKLNGAPLNTYQVRVEGQEANNQRLMIRQDQVQPSVESLEEMSVQSNNFAAEYGQVTGGMFNMTVKSGTNQLHGSVFEYFVNEAFNAGLPYTNNGRGGLVRPPNRRHNYGGSIGGPVYIPKLYNGRNRTFFFFALEKFHQKQVVGGTLATMPTDAMRGGNFSEALTNRALTAVLDPLGRSILENVVYDPLTTRTANGQTVRDPFSGNIVPSSRFDPVALKIQDLIPRATRTGRIINNWDQSYEAATDKSIATLKFDHDLAKLGKASFYWSRYWGPHYNGTDGLPIPLTQVRRIRTNTHTFRLNYDVPVAPTFLLHAGLGFIRHTNPDQSIPEVLDYDPIAGLGLTGALFGKGFPRIFGLSSATGGGMSLGMGANGGPIFADKPTAVLSGTYVRNNHTFKAGGEWRIDTLTSKNLSGMFGTYNFSAVQTGLPSTQGQALAGGDIGLPYASFLLGLVGNANVSNPSDPQSRKPSISFFAQDNWKLTRKLSLDYGLRWDHQGYPLEIHRRTSGFAPSLANPSAGGLPGATAFEGYGSGRCNCRFANTYNYAFGPRIGAAYQINSKTVIRAGWGVSYAQTSAGQANIQSTLGAGGWNTINFDTAVYGDAALNLRNGIKYNSADLYRESFNTGIRPSRGLTDSPPALIDPGAGRPPRMAQWTFSLQRELSRNVVIEGAYVGNRGSWFQVNQLVNLNAVPIERLRAVGLDIGNQADQTLLRSRLDSVASVSRGFNRIPYSTYSSANTVAQSLRPYPQFGNLTVAGAPLGNTWYDSLQVKVTKRYSRGLDLLGTFTWQKELTSDVPGNDVFNRRNQKGLSSLSEPYIFVLAFNYRTPALGSNKWIRSALGGWTLGGILRYASGLPIPVPGSQNQLGSLLFQSTRMNRVQGEPLYLSKLNCRCFDPNKDFVLNPKAWSDAAPGQWGFSAPYYNDFRYQRRPDEQLSFGRVFQLRERMSFQLRAEFFNAFNRIYMNDPSAANPLQTPTRSGQGVPTAGFGRVDTGSLVTQPRNGQIVARFQF